MLALWWLGRLLFKLTALFVFLCAVYFVREVVHEGFDPKRQAVPARAVSLTGFVVAGAVNDLVRRF